MFQVLIQLKDYFKQNKWIYFLILSSLVISGAAEIYMPHIFGQFIDAIVSQKMTYDLMFRYLWTGLLTIALYYGMSYVWGYGLFTKANDLRQEMRKELMRHLLKMRAPFFEKFTVGDLMTRGTTDLRSVDSATGYGLLVLLDGTAYISVLVFAMIYTTNWQLTLMTVLPLLPLAYIFNKLGAELNTRYKAAQRELSKVNSDVLEMVDGIRVVRAYVKEDYFIDRFCEQTQELYERHNGLAEMNAWFNPTIKIFESVSIMFSLIVGSYFVAEGALSLGQMISFQMYVNMMVWPLIALSDLVLIMSQGSTSMERYTEVISANDSMIEPGNVSVEDFEQLIWLNYSFAYPSSDHVNLTEINLKIKKGETLGVVGKIGSGKTTLARQLLREYPLGTGKILLNGHELQTVNNHSVNRLIGYVPQEHILFSRSIRENILFGKSNATDEEVLQSIRLANFEDDLNRLDDGWHTLVGEKGSSISGGQKQRLSIARALIKNPPILILDDSLSAVDTRTEQHIIENIKNHRRGQTNIIISHRLSAIKEADNIIVMDHGRIIERGTHTELMASNGWYCEQFIRQEMKGQSRSELLSDSLEDDSYEK